MLLAFLFPLFVIFGAIMAHIGFTLNLMLKYPHIFSCGLMSHQGPIEANRKAVEFIYTLIVKGWTKGTSESQAPNKEILVRVSGKDPFYGITSKCVLMCAKTILQEHHKMPGKYVVFISVFIYVLETNYTKYMYYSYL